MKQVVFSFIFLYFGALSDAWAENSELEKTSRALQYIQEKDWREVGIKLSFYLHHDQQLLAQRVIEICQEKRSIDHDLNCQNIVNNQEMQISCEEFPTDFKSAFFEHTLSSIVLAYIQDGVFKNISIDVRKFKQEMLQYLSSQQSYTLCQVVITDVKSDDEFFDYFIFAPQSLTSFPGMMIHHHLPGR